MTSANMLSVPALRTSGGCALHTPSRDEWIALAAEFQDHNYRHCWDYSAMMAKRAGATEENVVITHDDEPLALVSVRVKPLRAARTGIAYVSGGPLVRHADTTDAGEALNLALATLKREYVARRKLVLRIHPAPGDAAWNHIQGERFAAASFVAAENLPAYRSMYVDIARPLAEVRTGLAQKWRNCLNKAERQELQIVVGFDRGLFDQFSPLFDELVTRKSFSAPLGPDFYAELQDRLPERERLLLAIAWVDDAPAAGVVASIHGDTAVYLLGASNDAARKRNAAYLLQWKVIEAAAARGCRWYDLGGVDIDDNPGVYKFKLGFGGEERVSPGPYEIGSDRVRWNTVRAAERAYRVLSNARRPR